MGTIAVKEILEPKPRVRFLFGIRRLMFFVLLAGLFLGWLHQKNQFFAQRDVLLSQLQTEKVYVNHQDPSYLTLFLMKVHGVGSNSIEEAYSKWISPGWFSSPRGFNAGHLPEDKVGPLVERLRSLGQVKEVLYRGGSLDGLRLFYIGEVPVGNLGPEGANCLIREHDATLQTTPRRVTMPDSA